MRCARINFLIAYNFTERGWLASLKKGLVRQSDGGIHRMSHPYIVIWILPIED